MNSSWLGSILLRVVAASLGVATSFVGATHIAWGANLSFSPVNVHVPAPSKAGAIRIRNKGKEPVELQLRLFEWASADRNSSLRSTQAAIVSPAFVSIPPEQSYTFRVSLLNEPPTQTETSYRLIIDELPRSVVGQADASAVRMNLRTSLPVFFTPKGAAPQVTWTLKLKDGSIELIATNEGSRHLKLVGLAIDGPDGKTDFTAAGVEAYVLPGSTMTYRPSKPLSKTYPPGTTFTLTTNPSTPFAVNQQITLTGD